MFIRFSTPFSIIVIILARLGEFVKIKKSARRPHDGRWPLSFRLDSEHLIPDIVFRLLKKFRRSCRFYDSTKNGSIPHPGPFPAVRFQKGAATPRAFGGQHELFNVWVNKIGRFILFHRLLIMTNNTIKNHLIYLNNLIIMAIIRKHSTFYSEGREE
ncbi:hypothetical protein [Caenibacillus caldisaponilyticus]|uniref:hypothetical protein n=1 Tax=Caenibacillus caldisaponilyticus TaxID=1674942 RepID=UPI001177D9E1|nr:hypothetical protein [Caenibacillus caldisaponilyticus]